MAKNTQKNDRMQKSKIPKFFSSKTEQLWKKCQNVGRTFQKVALKFSLRCVPPESCGNNWSCKADCEMTLKSTVQDEVLIYRCPNLPLAFPVDGVWTRSFVGRMKWSDLVDPTKGYFVDGSLFCGCEHSGYWAIGSSGRLTKCIIHGWAQSKIKASWVLKKLRNPPFRNKNRGVKSFYGWKEIQNLEKWLKLTIFGVFPEQKFIKRTIFWRLNN